MIKDDFDEEDDVEEVDDVEDAEENGEHEPTTAEVNGNAKVYYFVPLASRFTYLIFIELQASTRCH